MPQEDTLDQLWASAQSASATNTTAVPLDLDQLRHRSSAPLRTSLRSQVLTVLILSLVLTVLTAYFVWLVDLQQVLSVWGMALMLGSLIIRIAIELGGIVLTRRIDRTASTADFVARTERLLAYRTGVHGSVVAICLLAYFIGYYLLFPEFAEFFSTPVLWLLGGSFIVIMALVVGLAIRPGLQEERLALEEMRRMLAA